jgi:hypothetical protein
MMNGKQQKKALHTLAKSLTPGPNGHAGFLGTGGRATSMYQAKPSVMMSDRNHLNASALCLPTPGLEMPKKSTV